MPEQDQRRRYPRSFAHLNTALQLADEVALFDNSGMSHRLIFIRDGSGVSVFPPFPEWMRGLEL